MKTVTEKALENIVYELKNINKSIVAIANKSSGSQHDSKRDGIKNNDRDTFVIGEISDLMSEMMDGNAPADEIERIIKFSQKVMDAKRDYNIYDLYDKYHRHPFVMSSNDVKKYFGIGSHNGWEYPNKADFLDGKEDIEGMFAKIFKEEDK